MRSWRQPILPLMTLLAALLSGRPAMAEEAADAPAEKGTPAQIAHEALYQEALLSLAEGRKTDASEQLSRLIEQSPLHAGALLDLALIQCELGHADEAEHLFATVETRFNPSRAFLELIANAREAGCKAWQAVSSGSVTFGRGIDQNVNQGASTSSFIVDRGGSVELPLLPDFLPKHDQYSLVSADYMREVTPNGSLGFAQYQIRHNDRLHQYDSTSLFVGIESPFRFGRWTMRTTGMLGLVGLGGQLYQRQLQLQARVTPPLPLPNNMQFNLMGGVSHIDYLTLTNFNSNTLELRGQLSYRKDDAYASISLGALDDRATAQRPGGNRRGTFANLLLRRRVAGELTGEFAYTRQGWNSSQPYAPDLLIDQVRHQATHVLRGTLIYPVARNQNLQLEARVVRNQENISIFQYNNRQLQLSWQWQWP